MTAIHLPPGSPSGQPVDVGTLRAQVSANKLAALIPTTSPGGATIRQSDGTSTGAVELPVRTGPQGQPSAATPVGSTRETLSFAARTILTLLAQGSAAPLRSAGPLLAVPPTRLPEGTAQVRQALMHLVQDSGLFYESHLAQWIAGERGLASLAREPQAGIGRHPYPGSGAGGAPHGNAASGQGAARGTYGAEPGSPMRPSATAPLPTLPSASPTDAQALSSAIQALAAAEPSQAVLDAALNAARSAASTGPDAAAEDPAARPGDTGARTGDAPRGSETPRSLQAAAQAYQAAANDAARQAGSQTLLGATSDDAQARPDATANMAKAEAAPAIHPNTEGIVRQQLELLATQQFRWAGEAWPGTPMQWDIAEQHHQRGAPAEHGDEADERTWSSRLLLELPQLGTVEARLTLTPTGLETRLAVQEDRIARMLDDAQDRLRNNLGARGIDLLHFSIRRDTDAEGAA